MVIMNTVEEIESTNFEFIKGQNVQIYTVTQPTQYDQVKLKSNFKYAIGTETNDDETEIISIYIASRNSAYAIYKPVFKSKQIKHIADAIKNFGNDIYFAGIEDDVALFNKAMGIDREYILTVNMYRQSEIDNELPEKKIYQEAQKGTEEFNEAEN